MSYYNSNGIISSKYVSIKTNNRKRTVATKAWRKKEMGGELLKIHTQFCGGGDFGILRLKNRHNTYLKPKLYF